MASMFRSVLDRATKLPTRLRELLTHSPTPPAASSSSSSSPTCCSQLMEDLEKLRRRMDRIVAHLNDAEEREIKEESVGLWLLELRNVAYESEDVLDEVDYELIRHQLACEEAAEHAPAALGEKRGFKRKRDISDSQCRVAPPRRPLLHDTSFQQQIIAKIAKINGRFDEIHEDGLKLKLHPQVLEPRHHMSATPPRIPTSCLVDERGVRGRDDDKRNVLRMLLDDAQADDVGVVSIVGMGGIGKTTLAQLVYNDHRVINCFQKILWVCVSNAFDVTRLSKQILQELVGSPSEVEELNSLQKSLREELSGKRFLLVLDDVWNESPPLWEALWVSLLSGAQGSRVLITTRSEKVSRVSCATERNMYCLVCLSEEDSWSLFEQRAFAGRNSSDYPDLVAIGRQIVKKCKGLPLTVKTLSWLLSCEFGEGRWEDILRSELWELPEGKHHILPALRLSYHHLPSPIKPCFAFCAVFPKDHRFVPDELILMWMAQGYLKSIGRQCMEDVGRGYFEDLLQRSFFQKSEYGDRFVMHDIIHDLAMSIWDGECCMFVQGKPPDGGAHCQPLDCNGDIRRLLSHKPVCVSRRTLNVVPYPWGSYDVAHLRLKPLDDMFLSMKYLRVLDICDVEMGELPDSIGNLTHLRYLRIEGWSLSELPESLGNLLHLQTLDVRGARFVELVRSIKDLVNLRQLHLDMSDLRMMPCGIGRLTQLRTLPRFVVGEGSGAAGIEELSGLNDLQGELELDIRSLSNNNNNWVTEAGCCGGHNYGKGACILKNKKGLEALTLNFGYVNSRCEDDSGSPSMHQHDELVESLQPHTNIKQVRIHGFSGIMFPKWMRDPSYSRLESVYLTYCKNCIGVSFGTEGRTFSRLRQLTIRDCPMLTYVKLRCLTALRELSIDKCEGLTMLDYYYDVFEFLPEHPVLSQGKSPLELQRQQQDVIPYNHIPNIHSMWLGFCPKLNFLPEKQQQLPPSLKRLYIFECPLLKEWLKSHLDKSTTTLSRLSWNDEHLVLLNVVDVKEACGEDTPERSYFEKMELRWDLQHHQMISSSPAEAEQVLHQLCPNSYLKELMLQGYRGYKFPAWVGDPNCLVYLVKVALSGCVHCRCLPPLGLLPALQELHISTMGEVKYLGHEFCGHGGTFQSLRTLEFQDMPQWEEWQLGVQQDEAFPNLHVLKIYNCPKLTTLQLTAPPQFRLAMETPYFSSLSKLQISCLPNLKSVSFTFWTARGFGSSLVAQNFRLAISWPTIGLSRPMPTIQVQDLSDH